MLGGVVWKGLSEEMMCGLLINLASLKVSQVADKQLERSEGRNERGMLQK